MLDSEDDDDRTIYKVVINDEEQYSIWPAERQNAPGWHDVGKNGAKAECLAFIDSVWTDMRPRSLREKMAQGQRDKEALPVPQDEEALPMLH
jgi:MbtH protein